MILLTGASGFIGKHLLAALIEQYGADEIVALTSKPITECRYLLHNNYEFDDDHIAGSGFADVHTIIHAGAFTPKNGSEANDRVKSNSNITNTDRLLSANLPALKRVVYLSTLDVYAPAPVISETSAIAPVSLYGASKFYAEEMVKAWALSNNKEYQVLRVGHVYGPGEEAYQKIIPVSIKRLLNKQPVQIWGTGDEIRSFIFINDVVAAIVNAVKIVPNQVVNLVGGNQITINRLVNKLIEISGEQVSIENVPSQNKGRDLVFDNSRMKALLLPVETGLEDGLSQEWEYMKGLTA